MKDKILELRAKGYTYNQIVEELGCSKSTVAYHCGDGQKNKTQDRQKKRRAKNPIFHKIENFKHRKQKEQIVYKYTKSPKHALQTALGKFLARQKGKGSDHTQEKLFTFDEFWEEHSETNKCYLTGRPIDFNNVTTYSFDHIIPSSKGGTNNLSNLGVTCRQANFAKGDMSIEEFLQLCIDVLENFDIIEHAPEALR